MTVVFKYQYKVNTIVMVNTIYICVWSLHNRVKSLFHTSGGTMPTECEIEDIVKPGNLKLCSVQVGCLMTELWQTT